MENENQIISELNTWIDSIENPEPTYEFLDVEDNLWTKMRTAHQQRGIEFSEHLSAHFYPEDFNDSDVGNKSNELFFDKFNSQVDNWEDITVFSKYLSDDELKTYFNLENYLLVLTDRWYFDLKRRKDEKSKIVAEKHDILNKLRLYLKDDDFLTVWKLLFNHSRIN